MERLLDEISFDAAKLDGQTIAIDARYVDDRLAGIAKDDNLSQFIL
jgi:ATP-dependent HslUV protease ATP-binding subunit HslU